jgi:hypothetical protein
MLVSECTKNETYLSLPSSTIVLGKFFVGVSGLVLRDLREK